MSQERPKPDTPSNETPLQGWKEIGAYLERDQRTARRWELEERLPIRRHRTDRRSSVYAYASEIDAWRAARPPEVQTSDNPARNKRIWVGGLAAAALAGAWLISGPILNPPTPLANAAARTDPMVSRRVWAGKDVDDYGGLSPDGRFLSYAGEDGSLMMRDLESGENRTLVQGDNQETGFPTNSVFRPDGRAIAYVWWNHSDPNAQTVDLRLVPIGDNGTPNQSQTVVRFPLGDESGRVSGLAASRLRITGWTPEGERVLAVTSDESRLNRIAFVSAEDGKVTTLKTVGWEDPNPLISPDGRFVAYDLPAEPGSPQRDIFVLEANGEFEAPAVSHPADDALVAWAPGSKALLFTSNRKGATSLYSLPMRDGRPTGEPTIIKTGSGPMRALGAPAGGRLLYSIQSKTMEIRLADLASIGNPNAAPKILGSRFPGTQRAPAFSPDGRYLSYLVLRGRVNHATTRLVVRDLKSGEETSYGRETTGATLSRYGVQRFSPDSRRILLNGWDSRGRGSVIVVDLESGPTMIVPLGGHQPRAEGWLDNDTVLLRAQVRQWREEGRYHQEVAVIALDLESRKEREIYRQSAYIRTIAVSPDRRRFAVPQKYSDEADRVRMRLWTVVASTGESAVAGDFPAAVNDIRGVAWSPDGEDLYVTVNLQEQPRQLWRVPTAGGIPEETGLDLEKLRDVAIHPDGRQIALESGSPEVEIWALENFLPDTTD